MNSIKQQLCFISLLLMTVVASAQQTEIASGDLAILKGEKNINIEFTYDKVAVGEYAKEEEYVKHKVEDMNKKEAGTGDEWAQRWVSGRKDQYEPKFIEAFTKYSEMTMDSTAKYTLIFKTTFIEPGYQVVVSKKASQVEGTITLVETAKRTKKLAVISVERGGGYFRGGAFDFTGRIAEVYFVTGKKAGTLVKKEAK